MAKGSYDDPLHVGENGLLFEGSAGEPRWKINSENAPVDVDTEGVGILLADGSVAMTGLAAHISKDEYYDRQRLHFGDFGHWSSNAPASGTITNIIGRARITIDAPALTDWAEIYALLYKDGGTDCDIDSKACSLHCRLTITEDDVSDGDKAEETCGYIRYLGANAQIGILITFERDDAADEIYYRLYPYNDYWDGDSWERTTGTCFKTLTFGAAESQSVDLFFYSDASDLYCYADNDPTTVQSVAIDDDNGEGNAELDFYLMNDADYNLDMELNQLTFVRAW